MVEAEDQNYFAETFKQNQNQKSDTFGRNTNEIRISSPHKNKLKEPESLQKAIIIGFDDDPKFDN